tara:strand:+ start:171 stop:392 length:222 start_codon:yes stop_codon:yes gene_type:complete
MTMEKFPAIGASWARAESFMRSKRNALAAYASGVYMGRLLNRGHVDRGDSEYSSVFFLQLLLGVVMVTVRYMI